MAVLDWIENINNLDNNLFKNISKSLEIEVSKALLKVLARLEQWTSGFVSRGVTKLTLNYFEKKLQFFHSYLESS